MADVKLVRIESLPVTTEVNKEEDFLIVQQPDLTCRTSVKDLMAGDPTLSHVVNFHDGGTLNGPMDFCYYEEEDLYLRWTGEFPHIVPSLSSPYEDGDITDGAWAVYTDPSLRDELGSTIGASLILTEDGRTIQDTMDEAIDAAFEAVRVLNGLSFERVAVVSDANYLEGYAGHIVMDEKATVHFPDVARGENTLNGFVSKVVETDTSNVYEAIMQGGTTGAIYTIRVSEEEHRAVCHRHALKSEFSRYDQTHPTRTVIRAGDDADASYLQLDAAGRWGVWNPSINHWQPLAVEQGGTGARDANTAWAILGGKALGKLESIALTDDKITGVLPVAKGGTGAKDPASAWTNLGGRSLGKMDSIGLTDGKITGVLPVSKGGTGCVSDDEVKAWLERIGISGGGESGGGSSGTGGSAVNTTPFVIQKPAGAEEDKYYPVIINTPLVHGTIGTDLLVHTKPTMGSDPMNCSTLRCWYRTGGWTDRGDSAYGIINFYQNEASILGLVVPTRGQQNYAAIYVHEKAFPIYVYASSAVTDVHVYAEDFVVGTPTENNDGVVYKAGITTLQEAILGDDITNTRHLFDFTGGVSGFYCNQWMYRGNREKWFLQNKTEMGETELWYNGLKYICPGSQTARKALESNAGFLTRSEGAEDLINATFTSRCGNLGQAEFRATNSAGQIIVRDMTGTAHRFWNFNTDGTFSSPNGFVCYTGGDWNNQFGSNNPSKIMAGNVNGPEDTMVVGGLSVAFSGNYAFQMAGRLDQLYTRSIEAGNHRAWNKVIQHRGQGLGTNDLNDYKADREGIYHQEANANATAERNYPPGKQMAGTLIVLRNSADEGTGCIQIYKMYLGGTWERYYNNLGSGMAWSLWKRTSFPENTTAPVMPDLWLPLTSNLKPALGEGEMVFSRPSTATYFTKRGVMAVAQANQPRFERDGLLIEGQRTNLMLNSEDPSKWEASQQITVGGTVTNTNGTKGARFTVNTASGVGTTALNLATVPATRGADVTGAEKFCTGSIIARGGKANQRLRIRFDMYDGSTTTFQGDAYVNLSTLEVKTTGVAAGRIKVKAERWQTAGPAWIRVVATFEAVSSDRNIGCQFQISPPESSQHAVGDWVDVAIPQFELGSCESSFIPTGSSPVTRAADLCKFPMTDNLAPRPFTIAATVDANWRGWGKAPNAAPRVIDTEGHQSGAAFIMGFGSATNIAEDGYPYCNIGESNRRVYEMAKARKLKIGFRIKDDGKTCSFANGLVSTETQSSWEFLAGGAFIRIGGQTATGERHLFGHIKDIRVWNSALTDTQLMMESVE